MSAKTHITFRHTMDYKEYTAKVFSVRKVKRLFIWKQVIFGVLILLIALSLASVVSQQEGEAHRINLSSRQGVLSQRMTKSAIIINNTMDNSEIEKRVEELKNDLKVFTKVHIGLQKGDPELDLYSRELSKEVDALFQKLFFYYTRFGESVGHLVKYIEENGKKRMDDPVVGAYVQVVLNNEENYLNIMDQIISQFDQEAQERISHLQMVGIIAIVLLLIVLGAGIRFLYIPSLNRLEQTITELHISEEKYRQLFEFMPDLVMIQKKGKVAFINPAGVELLGAVSQNDLVGKPVTDLIETGKQEVYKNRIKKLEAKEYIKPIEYRMRKVDGSLVEVEAISTLIEDKNESSILSVARDITERLVAARAIKESEEKYRSVVNSVKEVIFQLDENGKWIFLNPAWYDISKYSISESIGESLKTFIHKDEHERVENGLKHLLLENIEHFRIEAKAVTKESEECWIYFYAYLTPGSDKERKSISGTVMDITERKKAQEEIEKYIEQLKAQKSVIERNAQELRKFNEQLTYSEAKLRELNASKDKFFSIIAHDLKSPFTSFIGISELLIHDIDEMDTEEIKTLTAGIYKSAKGVFNLLENLLQWARIQTGRMDFSPIIFDLNELIEEIMDLYQVNAVKKDISLEEESRENLQLNADRNMIYTVIRNLLSNAIKFTNPGGKVRLKAEQEDDFVQISIIDDGVGMSQTQMNKLFRIDVTNTTRGTDNEKGTGLGLILCKEFVEKNGGKIWVESEIENGTKFHFTVPVAALQEV